MLKKILIGLIVFSCLYADSSASAVSFTIDGVRVNKKIRTWRDIKNRNIVKQSLDYSCGPAGLATIMNYYLGCPMSEKEIIQTLLKYTNIKRVQERRGFSLLDLKKFAEFKGFNVAGYKMDVDFIRELKKPVLVPIKFKNFRHFIVIKAIIENKVFAADPTAGNIILNVEQFKGIWQDGIGLVIENKSSKANKKKLDIKIEDVTIVDAKSIKRIFDNIAIRTAVFPGEF